MTHDSPRKEYPMASIKCILAFLSQLSTPLISFGTRKSAANFSVSVSACSRTLIHFLTGSARWDLLSDVVSDGVLAGNDDPELEAALVPKISCQ